MNQLKIRCPECGQRFKVSTDLRDKMVECGACEHRFRITGDVILRTRKFYPGEHGDMGLARFSRMPTRQSAPVTFETVSYAQDVAPEEFDPPSFQRVLAGFLGWGLMALTLLALVLSQGSSGPFGAISVNHRMILVGFVAALGSGFIVCANRKNRMKVVTGALAASLLLCGITWLIPGPAQPETDATSPDRIAATGPKPAASPPESSEDRLETLKEEMRYGPVQQEIDANGGNAGRVTAIWLRGMRERYKYTVESYLRRITGADHSSHMYPRDDTGFLYVMTGIDQDIETTAQHCRRFGEVVRVIPSLRVIEVEVDSTRFIESPLERLSNPSDDAFYTLNLRELESIDLKHAERAIERLTEAPPVKCRSDIVRRMISLLNEAPPEMLGKLGLALEHWSKPGDGAEAAVLKRVFELNKNHDKIPEGLIAFLVARKINEVQPLLHDLWLENPDTWEMLYAGLGPPAEAPVLSVLADPNFSSRDSAVRILARVGTPAAIPTLEKLLKINDRKVRTDVTRAIEQIRKRAANPANPAEPEAPAATPPSADSTEPPKAHKINQ